MVPTHTHTHRSHLQRLFNYVCVGGEVTKRHSDSKRAEDEMTALIQLSSRLVTYLYVMSDDTHIQTGDTRDMDFLCTLVQVRLLHQNTCGLEPQKVFSYVGKPWDLARNNREALGKYLST